MQDKDYGIILSKIDYSETSYILRIYTSKNGSSSYLYRGAKKKKDQFKIYPLSIVEFEYGGNPKSELKYLNSLDTYVRISNCYFDPVKSSIVFFINEILQKTLQDSEADVELISFIISRLKFLDMDDHPLNFHLKFLADFSKFLGFYPSLSESICPYFDLQDGAFCEIRPKHQYFIEGNELKAFDSLLKTDYQETEKIDFQGIRRNRLLHLLLDYYALQIESFGKVKTVEVLETIFND